MTDIVEGSVRINSANNEPVVIPVGVTAHIYADADNNEWLIWGNAPPTANNLPEGVPPYTEEQVERHEASNQVEADLFGFTKTGRIFEVKDAPLEWRDDRVVENPNADILQILMGLHSVQAMQLTSALK